jgi:CheY-like chemotaxis protein
MSRVLVIDDDPDVARTLVTSWPCMAVGGAGESGRGLDMSTEPFEAVLLDVRLPALGFETAPASASGTAWRCRC